MKGNTKILRGVKVNGLYFMCGTTIIGSLDNTECIGSSSLWHKRLGHLGEKGLMELLLCGEKISKLPFCETCVMGKARKSSFDTGKHATEYILAYVHSDLAACKHTNHGRFVLKYKDQAFAKFKEWLIEIENKTGKSLKYLRSDNGIEFLSDEFNNYCKEKGVTNNRTVAGTPQQNGIAERLNKTLLERVRCMLLSSGLSKMFWGDAVTTASLLINKCPPVPLKFKTPDHVWYGTPGNYTGLKVFGCLAYAHLKQDKLEARAFKCVFIGYLVGVKGFKLWCI